MAILDASMLFFGHTDRYTNQFVPQAANGTDNIIVGEGVVDLRPSGFANPGGGGMQAMDVAINVATAPTGGTSVRFQFVQADDDALTANVQVLAQTGDLPIASLPAGTQMVLRWGRTAPFLEKRYVGMRVVNIGVIANASYLAAQAADGVTAYRYRNATFMAA